MKIFLRIFDFLLPAMVFCYASGVRAEEIEDPSTFNYWYLGVFVVLLLLFRKVLVAEATPESAHHESEHHEHEETHEVAVATDEVVDLTVEDDQCQGTTTKGARCARKTGLETVELGLNGKQYRLLVCKQHNNDALKPFSELV